MKNLVDMSCIEKLINNYVSCWMTKRPTYSDEWKDNDFGCEHLQIFRNGFNLEDFGHDELSLLAVLLTRELRGQINRDHKLFWSWCAFLTIYFEESIPFFSDGDWSSGFRNLINLVLSTQRHFPAGHAYSTFLSQTLRYVNSHLLETCVNKYQIAGPLTFSVLEGLLRRKNKDYVNTDGSVKRCFSVSNPQRGKKHFNPKRHNKLNRIDDLMRCFEELVTVNRGRGCPYLQQMKKKN